MLFEKNRGGHVERIMNQLADSVLGLSDEEVLAEIKDTGLEDAEGVRLVLRHAAEALKRVERRLWNLGHTINSRSWQCGQSGYHNKCANCGLAVSFTVATGDIEGSAVVTPCPEISFGEVAERGAYRQ